MWYNLTSHSLFLWCDAPQAATVSLIYFSLFTCTSLYCSCHNLPALCLTRALKSLRGNEILPSWGSSVASLAALSTFSFAANPKCLGTQHKLYILLFLCIISKILFTIGCLLSYFIILVIALRESVTIVRLLFCDRYESSTAIKIACIPVVNTVAHAGRFRCRCLFPCSTTNPTPSLPWISLCNTCLCIGVLPHAPTCGIAVSFALLFLYKYSSVQLLKLFSFHGAGLWGLYFAALSMFIPTFALIYSLLQCRFGVFFPFPAYLFPFTLLIASSTLPTAFDFSLK